MWLKAAILFIGVLGAVWADCDNSITVSGVSTLYGNDIVNGEYLKIEEKGCDSRDVFNHSSNDIYLYHVGDLNGYWMFRDVYDCRENIADSALVRSKDAEANPGLILSGWEEQTGTGNFEKDNNIDVKCYDIPRCRYQVKGAWNTNLNGYYDTFGATECEWREVHKHESRELYIYFKWSDVYREYYWVIDNVYCQDTVYSGAIAFNDDYSISPELILDTWIEHNGTAGFIANPNFDIDCFDVTGGASRPGVFTGMMIAVLALWSII